MWSECHHSYWERDRYGSGSSLPLLAQLQAWDCLRLCGLSKEQFKAQNHMEKMLPCWGILVLPIAVVVQAGRCCERRQDSTSLPWSLGWVQQAHLLGCAWYVCTGRTFPAGAVHSFPPCGPNLPSVPLSFLTRNCLLLLPLLSTVVSASTDLPEPSPSSPDSQIFTVPCVQENLQGTFGFFDIIVLSPLPPPFHLQSCVLKALSESGKLVLPRVRKDH